MKKIFGIIVVAVAMIGGYNVYTSSQATAKLSNLALSNIEALAQYGEGETADGRKLYEHHCGSGAGTQCKALGVTGNSCPVERSCP